MNIHPTTTLTLTGLLNSSVNELRDLLDIPVSSSAVWLRWVSTKTGQSQRSLHCASIRWSAGLRMYSKPHRGDQ
jgi:hypothetical protein